MLFQIGFCTNQIHFCQTRNDGRPQVHTLFLIRTLIDGIHQEHGRFITLSRCIIHTRLNTTYQLGSVFSHYIITSTQIIGFRLNSGTLESICPLLDFECAVRLLFNIQLLIHIICCLILFDSISKSPIFILSIRISHRSIIIYPIFYITFHNKLAAQILGHTVFVQIEFHQFQVSGRGGHFFPTRAIDTNIHTTHTAITIIIFVQGTTNRKNGFAVYFRNKLRISGKTIILLQFITTRSDDIVSHSPSSVPVFHIQINTGQQSFGCFFGSIIVVLRSFARFQCHEGNSILQILYYLFINSSHRSTAGRQIVRITVEFQRQTWILCRIIGIRLSKFVHQKEIAQRTQIIVFTHHDGLFTRSCITHCLDELNHLIAVTNRTVTQFPSIFRIGTRDITAVIVQFESTSRRSTIPSHIIRSKSPKVITIIDQSSVILQQTIRTLRQFHQVFVIELFFHHAIVHFDIQATSCDTDNQSHGSQYMFEFHIAYLFI